MVDKIEKQLDNAEWLGGKEPTKTDNEEYEKLVGKEPKVNKFPNAYAWFTLVSQFTPAARSTWGGAPAATSAKGPKYTEKQDMADQATHISPLAVAQEPKKAGEDKMGWNGYPETVREYFEDSYRFTSKGNKVIAVVEAPDAKDGQMAVVLDKTICHPQGGGQPDD